MTEEILIEQPECREVKIKVFSYGFDLIQDGSMISFDDEVIPQLIEHLKAIHDKSL